MNNSDLFGLLSGAISVIVGIFLFVLCLLDTITYCKRPKSRSKTLNVTMYITELVLILCVVVAGSIGVLYILNNYGVI